MLNTSPIFFDFANTHCSMSKNKYEDLPLLRRVAHSSSSPPAISSESSSVTSRTTSSPCMLLQYVVLMRHGERRDSLQDAPHEVDPPLTERGKEEVQHAAQRVKQLIGQSAAKKLMMISSPFVRTMETAAELQRYNVAVDRPATIDNTLCEVFGPIRIKSNDAPNVQRKDAIGQLPRWGESIQAATQRFVDSFTRNANANATEHVLLVTHGDAISAVLSHFYPMRMVYNTDFLSFIIMRRATVGSDRFVLHASHGVDWIIDGDDEEILPNASPELGSNVGGNDFHEKAGMILASRGSGDSVSTPVTYESPLGSSPGSGGWLAPSGHARQHSSGDARVVSKPDANPVASSIPSPSGDIPPPQNRNCTNNRKLVYVLHALIVLSQVPALRLWQSTRDATIYLVCVASLELLSLRHGWRSFVDRLPFSYGSSRRRVLYRLARYPLTRTVWKLLALAVIYVVVSVPLAFIARDNVSNSIEAISTWFTDGWNALLAILMAFLDVWRGYLDNESQEDDPHREAI